MRRDPIATIMIKCYVTLATFTRPMLLRPKWRIKRCVFATLHTALRWKLWHFFNGNSRTWATSTTRQRSSDSQGGRLVSAAMGTIWALLLPASASLGLLGRVRTKEFRQLKTPILDVAAPIALHIHKYGPRTGANLGWEVLQSDARRTQQATEKIR